MRRSIAKTFSGSMIQVIDDQLHFGLLHFSQVGFLSHYTYRHITNTEDIIQAWGESNVSPLDAIIAV